MKSNYHKATLHLRKSDPVLAHIIKSAPPFNLRLQRGYFKFLVKAIMYQQLAGPAARTIFNRFKALYPRKSARGGSARGGTFPTALDIAKTSDKKLRSAGLSRQKISYLRDLSQKSANGTLQLKGFTRMTDAEVLQNVTSVKGIGNWTGQMLLIFSLGRLDILPTGDWGFVKGVRDAYGFKTHPKPRTIEKLAEKWKPYRSVATWYLWHFKDNEVKNKRKK